MVFIISEFLFIFAWKQLNGEVTLLETVFVANAARLKDSISLHSIKYRLLFIYLDTQKWH